MTPDGVRDNLNLMPFSQQACDYSTTDARGLDQVHKVLLSTTKKYHKKKKMVSKQTQEGRGRDEIPGLEWVEILLKKRNGRRSSEKEKGPQPRMRLDLPPGGFLRPDIIPAAGWEASPDGWGASSLCSAMGTTSTALSKHWKADRLTCLRLKYLKRNTAA